MNDYLLVGLFALLFLFLIYTIIAFYVAYTLSHPKVLSLDESRKMENKKSPGLMELYDSWNIHNVDLHTKNGYRIRIYDVIPLKETNKFCILVHGYTYTHHGTIKYAKMMMKLGYHIIMFDQRYHGDSEGPNSTLGGMEKYDLYDVITYTFDQYGKNIFLGIYGESMGSSTVILEQVMDSRVSFVLSDCGFSSLETLVRYLVKRKIHLPMWPLISFVRFFFFLQTKVRFGEVCPKDYLSDTKIPFFYAHGLDDRYILPFHTQILYDSTPSYKELYFAPNNAKHAESARKNETEYFEAVTKFMKETEKIYHQEVKK